MTSGSAVGLASDCATGAWSYPTGTYQMCMQSFLILEAYSKTCVKRPHKNRQNKGFMTNGSLMMVESIAECSPLTCNKR